MRDIHVVLNRHFRAIVEELGRVGDDEACAMIGGMLSEVSCLIVELASRGAINAEENREFTQSCAIAMSAVCLDRVKARMTRMAAESN